MNRDSRSKGWALVLCALGLLAFLTLFRLAFLQHFQGLASLKQGETLRAMYLGLKFDARWVAILIAPAWLLLKPGGSAPDPGWKERLAPYLLALALVVYTVLVIIAMPDDLKARPWLLAFFLVAGAYRWAGRGHGLATHASARWLWGGFAAFALGATVLGLFVDFGAYAYIHTRLNGTLLMFLDNPDTSLQMIWQSYPVLRLALLLAAFLALTAWLFRWLIGTLQLRTLSRGSRIAVNVGGSLLLVFVMYGKWSRYPLRWGEAFEARAAFNAHLALNPLLFFLETRAEMDEGYRLNEVKASHATLAAYFGIPVAYDAKGEPTLRRRIEPRPQVQGSPNLVLIQLESLAAVKTSPFGNPLNPTPFLHRLSKEGIFFDRFNVVMENTSRSMFATLFGIPDVSSVQNATRNPLVVNQHTPLAALPEYEKDYFLGGSANWAQIRAALKNNLRDVRLHEEGSYSSPVVDVWGISDADLLKETHEVIAAKKAPFLAYVQTSGNHPPFTIPKHHTDFQLQQHDAGTLKAAGFVSNEEFNAVRLMDYALESFFTRARTAPYFANTIFVLWADHGIPRGEVDKRFGDLGLAIHHIPCIIYAPGMLAPRRISTVGTQMDLLPTLLSLMGRRTWTQTLGKDLFDPRYATTSAAFTFTTFRRPPRIGLLQEGYYLNLDADGKTALFGLEDPTGTNRAAADPGRTTSMRELARAFQIWSHYLMTHNLPIPEAP